MERRADKQQPAVKPKPTVIRKHAVSIIMHTLYSHCIYNILHSFKFSTM